MDPHSTISLRSGNRMPVLALGTWQLTHDTAGAVAHALELGYRMIDTSGDYGTQPGIAEAIKRAQVSRDDLYVVTKVEENEDTYESARKNVAELQLDYADLILIHRPPKQGVGEDLWKDLIRARDEGLTKDIGVSNYSAQQIKDLIKATGEVPAVNQIEWSPFGYSDAMLAYARENHITIQAYSPLTRTKRLNDEILNEIGKKYDKTPAQVLIRWNLQLGTVPLPKANRREHQEENIAVFDFILNDDHMIMLSHLNERYSALGSLPYE